MQSPAIRSWCVISLSTGTSHCMDKFRGRHIMLRPVMQTCAAHSKKEALPNYPPLTTCGSWYSCPSPAA